MKSQWLIKKKHCFNPCFNGRCIRTVSTVRQNTLHTNSFNPCFNGRCIRTSPKNLLSAHKLRGFNPCFNGRCIRTHPTTYRKVVFSTVSILVLMEDV